MNFNETFTSLSEIEKYYRDSKKVKNKEEALFRGENAFNALLIQYADNQDAKKYLAQIHVDIKNRLGIQESHLNPINNYPLNEDAEKYGKYYNQSRYQALLPYCQLAYMSEQNGIAQEHALKLSVIFDNTEDAVKYIDQAVKNKKTIHDACLFVLPDVKACDFNQWKKLIKTNINNQQFRALLPKAAELEKILKENKPKLGQKLDVNLISEKKKEIEVANKEFKELKRKHGEGLSYKEEKRYHFLIQELSDLHLSLYQLSAGTKFSGADLTILLACNEYCMQQNIGPYQYMLKQGLTKNDYLKFTKLKRVDDDTQIPNLKLDGKDYGYPGYYLMKVPVMDEMHAARAACFGKLTDCCQSLSGEAGEPCVIHGLTSKYGGFYVVCKGDIDNPLVEDEVLGQSWAWRSKKNAIVLDSIEVGNKDKITISIVKELFETLGKKIVTENKADKFACGSESGISKKLGIETWLNEKEEFIDYNAYCDSSNQRVIFDKNNPFYRYGKFVEATQATEALINLAMQDNRPLDESPYLCAMLDWSLPEKRSDIVDKLLEIAEKNQRKVECEKIIKIIEKFINNQLSADDLTSIEKKSQLFSILDSKGRTALIQAVEKENMDFSLKLIDKGADVNAKNPKGLTPLMIALERKNMELSLALINKDADIHVKNNEGSTPLMITLESKNTQASLTLINKGADINTKNKFGETPLMKALQYGEAQIALELIKRGSEINAQDKSGCTALMKILENDELYDGVAEIALELIKQGVDVNARNDKGDTALMLALQNKKTKVALELIMNGADINGKNNKSGYPTLATALQYGNTELALELIKKGADINVKYRNKNFPYITTPDNYDTPLITALEYKNKIVVLELIKRGADINARDGDDFTPLINTLRRLDYDFALELIDKGADLYLKDKAGLMPLDTIKKYHPKFFERIKDKINVADEANEKIASANKPKAGG